MQGIEPPYTDPYVRWCERSTSQLMASLLLDLIFAEKTVVNAITYVRPVY